MAMKSNCNYVRPETYAFRDEMFYGVLCQSPSGEIEPWTEENVEW